MSYNFLDKTGLAYFWSKIKAKFDSFSRNDLAVIDSREYSGIYGSANDQANASFYFGGIKPNNYYDVWKVKFRVYSNVPNQNEYKQYSDVEYYGSKNDLSYKIYNRMANTGGRCYYYHNVCRLNATGFNAGYKHILGMGLRASNNPTSSSYPRYFKIELLETDKCTFTFYDSMKKISAISEYNTTNYSGISEYDGCNNGLRESGDDNDISNLRIENGSIIAGTNGVKQNSLCAMDSTGKYQSFTTTDGTGTSKTVNTSAKFRNPMIIFKNNSGTNYANNAEVGTGYQSYYASPSVDLRYSCNNSANFAINAPTYLECTKDSDGYFSVTSNIILQTGFTSGRYYIYLGNTRRDQKYLMDLQPDHPVFYYDGSKLINENELKANKTSIPTKTSQLTNDSNFSYSIEKASGTIDDLAAFTSGKPGITGSISLTKKSSGIGSEIPAGWYNFYFSPHRTGSGGDNMNYGNIILTPMTFSGKSWILRRASNATTITEVKSVSTNEDLSLKTDTSVLPNDNGEIKTKYRVSNKAYTGSNTTIWYYPLCKLPTDNNGNYASAIISGRIGGWVSANMSYINALAWNRNGTGISLLDIAGSGNMSNIWGTCDIVIYTDAETVSETTDDNGIDTVYLKCKSYFTFDLDLEMFQSTAEILYDGTYLTTEPTGTLVAQASTSTKRAELYNGKLYVAGKELANTDTVTTSKNGLMISTDKTKVDNIDRLLTSENLNNLLSTGTYYSGGGNTVSNKPTGVDAFGLKVFRTAAGFWTQELIEGNTTPGARWTRQQSNNTWSSWTKMLWTDTTYTSKAAASGGTDVSLVTTGEKYTWNSKTSNTGTVTSVAVKMNGTTKGTVTSSGTIDLGTVVTDVSGKQDKLVSGTNIKTINNTSVLGSGNINIGGGITALDVYPVGSIYMSMNDTDPGILFGGTWVQIVNQFLFGAGQGYSAGDTGGEATHQLTKAELPSYDLYNASHSHNFKTYSGYGGRSGTMPAVNDGTNQGTFTATPDSATIKVSSGGSNTPHNNMPPYLAVYMWQRTA